MFNNRKCLMIVCFSFMLLLAGCNQKNEVSREQTIVSGENLDIFVTTDVHYLAESLNDNGAAFQKYISSGDGRLLHYTEEIVDAFLDETEEENPDILIISGDLTNNGEKDSHLELAEKLKNLEENTETRVYVIPGNHDIENPWARGFQGEKQYVTDSITASDFEEIYKDFGYQEAVSRDASSLSYLAVPSDDVWLLMLDTNVYQNNYKYGSPATYGKIKPETLEWICECSKLAEDNNARIITVMHHNLFKHSTVLSYGFTLDNNDEVLKLFQECNLNLVLSGHIHIQDIKSDKEETNPVYDIVTSALGVYPVQYGTLHYIPKTGFSYSTRQVDVENWAKKNGIEDENLLNFKKYGREFFAGRSYQSTYEKLMETNLYSEDEMKLMAEIMSVLNSNYFAGTVSDVREEIMASEGYKLWRNAEVPEMLTRYVQSMLYDSGLDNNQINVK
ncbi:metallophosphoesterase [Konateibacter massiliensis]|uniref:metallophosphoesterase n=1 Tax=Konateibacter massiliensis TaxID=2002841 RepID=UPI000C157D95|nr:metallophosphoesterase [Konateibacter massiliensis]